VTTATLEGQYLVSALCESQLPWFKELVALKTLEKTTVGSGGFFLS